MAGGIIDRFAIALGFTTDTSGLKNFERQAQQAKESILSIGTALTAFATGFAVKEIASIGDQFEQNKIAIAGFLSALEISPDFKTGLDDASGVVEQITKDAAKLPGEAEEYIEVFRAGLPFVQAALPGGGLKEITAFTNQLTAIGKTFQLPADQIGRELGEILSPGKGRATLRNRLFMSFLPLLHKIEGQAHLTSEQFNAMTESKRADLLQQSFARMQPMLDESANSFDAMKGAVKSALKQLVRLGSKGLFEGMKKGLAQINALFFDADGKITEFGQDVVDGAQAIGRVVTNIVTFGAAIVSWFAKSKTAGDALKAGLMLLGGALAALAFEKVTVGVARLFGGLLDLRRLLAGGLFLAIGLVAEDLYVFSQGGKSVAGMLYNRLGPAAVWFEKIVLGGLIASLVLVKRQAIMAAVALARPFLPIIAMGALVYYLTTRWKRFSEVTRASLVALGAMAGAIFLYMKRSAIQAAIGFAMMNLPLILIIGTLAALAAGIYYVVTRWNTFGAGAKTAIVVVTTALGVLGAAFVAIKAQAIAAGIRMAAAWLMGLGPVGLVILAVGALAVGLYELVQHWDEVNDAISRAVETAAKFLHISDDILGRKAVNESQKAFDEKTKGFGAPGGFKRQNDGEDTSFLQKPGAKGKGAAGKKPGGIGDILEGLTGGKKGGGAGLGGLLKGLVGAGGEGGIDFSAFGQGLNPAMAGGPDASLFASGAPVASMDGARAGAGEGRAARATNNYVANGGPVTINVQGGSNPDATAKAVRRELERANRSTIRDAQSKGPAL